MSGHVPACFVDGTRVCGFDEHPESVLSVPDSLDAAWAEAKAAVVARRALGFGGGFPLSVSTLAPLQDGYMAAAEVSEGYGRHSSRRSSLPDGDTEGDRTIGKLYGPDFLEQKL